MISAAIDTGMANNRKRTFGLFAQVVFSLNAAIQWIALEEAGREPRWAWRDPETGSRRAGTTTRDAELVDPLMLMLAEGRDDLYGHDAITNPHRLLFVVLAYADLVQIVARFGAHAHVSGATDPSINANALGARLAHFLERSAQEPSLQ